MLRPKLLTTLQGYSRGQFFSDITAGVVVGVVAIPLAIAFAIASGLSPEKGLYTAIIAGLLVSLLGGSRVQIGGPTGAFVIIVYGIVQRYGVDGLVLATLMAGAILMLMGFAKFGVVLKFVPRTVVVGFTTGIAVVIFSSQIKELLGLTCPTLPAPFVEKWRVILAHLSGASWQALALSALTIFTIVLWPRVSRRVPGSLVAIIVTSFLAGHLGWQVETIGQRFGALPHTLPLPSLPRFDLNRITELFQPAFTIAILGAMESLLSAVISDGMIGGRHRSNMELIAQGAANVGSALFGGMPATGAIARTVTNIKNGGRTPVAGIVHALTVLAVMFAFSGWLEHVPMACLAGVLAVVSYHMCEWRAFHEIFRGSRSGALVFIVTFLTTVLVDLTAAIELGVVLSAFLFLNRMSELQNIRLITDDDAMREREAERLAVRGPLPKGIQVYEIDGPLFFGVANQFDNIDRIVADKPKVRILRFKNVPLIDTTGLHALKSLHRRCQREKIKLIVTGIHVQPLHQIVKSELYDLIGPENVFNNMEDALSRAKELMGIF